MADPIPIVPECYICKEAVTAPSFTAQCSPACQQEPICYECLMNWQSHRIKEGAEPQCPKCKTAAVSVHVTDLELNIRAQVQAQEAAENDEANKGPAPSSESEEFDVLYFAGVEETEQGTRAKTIWCSRDLKKGDCRWDWALLSAVTEFGEKFQGFLKRWNIPSSRPLGFKWEHPVPIWVKARGACSAHWRCDYPGCKYKSFDKEESNCRAHCGIHAKKLFACRICGVGAASQSNHRRHFKKFHPAEFASAEITKAAEKSQSAASTPGVKKVAVSEEDMSDGAVSGASGGAAPEAQMMVPAVAMASDSARDGSGSASVPASADAPPHQVAPLFSPMAYMLLCYVHNEVARLNHRNDAAVIKSLKVAGKKRGCGSQSGVTTSSPSEAFGHDEADDGVYQVQAIKKSRKTEEGMEYLVKWVGYDEMTWETEEAVEGAQEAVYEFYKEAGTHAHD